MEPSFREEDYIEVCQVVVTRRPKLKVEKIPRLLRHDCIESVAYVNDETNEIHARVRTTSGTVFTTKESPRSILTKAETAAKNREKRILEWHLRMTAANVELTEEELEREQILAELEEDPDGALPA